MPSCAIPGCKNYSAKTKGIIYHVFPKDSSVTELWIRVCGNTNVNHANARICSAHFCQEDYVRDLKSELLGLPRRKILKQDAVPTMNLGMAPPDEMILFTELDNSNFVPIHAGIKSDKQKQTRDKEVQANEHGLFIQKGLETRIKNLEIKNRRLKNKVDQLTRQTRRLRQTLRNKNNEIKQSKRNVKEPATKILKNIFTESQVDYLVNGKKNVRWKKEDISRALTLRCISKRCYSYLRSKMHMPLPALSTLKRWVSRSFHCNTGFLHDVLTLMKNQAFELEKNETLSVLCFDEMNIDSRRSYDQEEDKVYGPNSQVQVIMARGLISNWKQPIYYNFDVQMTGSLLKKAITKMNDVGFKVVAVVCDLGGKNSKVWNDLQVTYMNPCFTNPTEPNSRVWVFSDIPHMIKLLRNHFIDTGLTLPGGKHIGREIIERLLAMDCGEIKLCPKLTQYHLSVSGRERQRVSLACQLFSKHTAQAISYTIPEEQETANFFHLVNDAFDIMNSRIPQKADASVGSAFGLQYQAQEEVLKKFYRMCQYMRVGKSLSLLPFQKGFMTSIRSLLGLYNDIKSCSIEYILTSRLNQDCLENLFSQVRAIGRTHDNPLPVDFKNRLRLLIMSRNVGSMILANTSPVTMECNSSSDYFTSRLFTGLVPEMTQVLSVIESDESDIRDFTVNNLTLECVPFPVVESECCEEGLRYLAGYVAFRCRTIDKTLGHPTSEVLHVSPRDFSTSGWIEKISRGGLIVPSEKWLEKVKSFEVIFGTMHGRTVAQGRGIIKTLTKALTDKCPELDPCVIKVYARTRTFIRIRHLNVADKAERCKVYHRKKARKWMASTRFSDLDMLSLGPQSKKPRLISTPEIKDSTLKGGKSVTLHGNY